MQNADCKNNAADWRLQGADFKMNSAICRADFQISRLQISRLECQVWHLGRGGDFRFLGADFKMKSDVCWLINYWERAIKQPINGSSVARILLFWFEICLNSAQADFNKIQIAKFKANFGQKRENFEVSGRFQNSTRMQNSRQSCGLKTRNSEVSIRFQNRLQIAEFKTISSQVHREFWSEDQISK